MRKKWMKISIQQEQITLKPLNLNVKNLDNQQCRIPKPLSSSLIIPFFRYIRWIWATIQQLALLSFLRIISLIFSIECLWYKRTLIIFNKKPLLKQIKIIRILPELKNYLLKSTRNSHNPMQEKWNDVSYVTEICLY